MGESAAGSVSTIRDEIACRVGPQRYKTWFKNTTNLTLTDSHLKVGVPNQFIGGWIESNLAETIFDAARSVTGRDLRIVFSIDPDLAGRQQKTQFNSQADYLSKNADRVVRHAKRTNAPIGGSNRKLRFRLESFVVGGANRLAYETMQSIILRQNGMVRTLLVHGASGLGKTHLLQGTCNALDEVGPSGRWAYVSGEEFTNQFIYALRTKKLDLFRERFRSLDVLVLDDVHFLASKKAIQEEFLFTFNAIDTQDKTVIMASDAHPRLIGQISEPLVNRFLSSLVIKIDPPDYETRREILSRRAIAMKVDVPGPVVEFVADRVSSNVRELEGALLKLCAQSSILGDPITMAMAQQVCQDHIEPAERIVRIGDIINYTAALFGVSPADITASCKVRQVTQARGVAMFLARNHTSLSFPSIARLMGNKNHSTVLLACRRVEKMVRESAQMTLGGELGPRTVKIADVLHQLSDQIKGPLA